MYITRMLAGRPYQCYVPESILPPVSDYYLAFFRDMDRWLTSSCDNESFLSGLPRSVAQPNNKLDGSLALENVRHAMKTPFAEQSIKQLKKANAALLGLSRTEFRTQLVWLGTTHPGLSWHVGSPPEMVTPLMKKLLDVPSKQLSPSMTAIILLFRLLQIHPFADGNGRTARYWAIRHIQHTIGPARGILLLIDRLWDRKHFDINGASLAAQGEKNFDPIFACIEQQARFLFAPAR
jgi:hypothetical protein